MSIDYSTLLKNQPKITVRAHGRGAGKTYAAVRWAMDKALRGGEVNIAVVGTSNDKYSFLEQFRDLAVTIGEEFEYFPSRRIAKLGNGATITFYDPERSETLRGPTHPYVVGESVQSWPEDSFFYVKSFCRPTGEERPEMWLNFTGTDSAYITELLANGFEATTN